MGAGHSHPLYVHEHSPLHHLASEVKIVGALGLAVSAAVTPREAIWAFAVYGAVVLGLISIAKVRFRFVATRLVAVAPFFLFALFLPFVSGGETTRLLSWEVSVPGLWGMWNIVAKATIGASASILLAATTEVPDIIRGFDRLRVPALVTAIAAFMIRYLELVSGEIGRIRVAMAARGYRPRWLRQTAPLAAAAGAMFIRSYERGERIHQAMLSRGFTGSMPDLGHRRATSGEWMRVGLLLLAVMAVAFTSLVIT